MTLHTAVKAAEVFGVLFAAGQATSAAEYFFQYSLFATTVVKIYNLFKKKAPAKIVAAQ